MARTVKAAGTIPWRITGSTLEVLLVHRPKYDDWSWPKGKVDKGETLAECAVRETAEETGLAVQLGQPLATVSYRLGNGDRKVCSYWAAREVTPDSAAIPARPSSRAVDPDEIDEMRWVAASKARDLLTHKKDRDPLGDLVDQHEDGKLATWTFAVVRHGRAMKRSAWKKGTGEEHDRPLTPTGHEQALALVPILAAFGIEDVVTSPWERCAATVRPYLEATGIGAEIRPELTEAAHRSSAKPVRRLVTRCVLAGDVPMALCTHRPVLPTVMETIAEHTPHRIFAKLPAADPWLATGEVLVVHVAPRHRKKARVVALERVRPGVA